MKINNLYIFIALFFSPLISSSQQFNDAEIKSAFIYKFITNIEWPNINELHEFKIALYGQDTSILYYLNQLSQSKDIADLPIKIIFSTDFNQIISENPQLIYITQDNNKQIKEIYYNVLTLPILIITDNSKYKIYSMLNFIYTSNNKISFELYKTNILNQNLKILPKLLLLGGTELDIKNMYYLKEKELLEEKHKVEIQQQKITEQKVLLDKQIDSIYKQNFLLKYNKKYVDSLIKEGDLLHEILEEKNYLLKNLERNIFLQKNILDQRTKQLYIKKDSIISQKNIITIQKKHINQKLSKLNSLNIEISEREKDIINQKDQLLNLQNKLSNQKLFLIFLITILVLVFLFSIFFVQNYKQKQRLNKELIIKNKEIRAQSKKLKQINFELEKLSIVARETDNGVIIADNEEEIIWVNEAFFKLIKNTNIPFDIVGKKISILNKDLNISKVFNEAIKQKKSTIFETYFLKDNSDFMWIQLTFSPIINYFDEVDKIIIICTDVSKIKLAEIKIELKNEELIIQRDKIQKQNDIIKQSILYAEKIQKAFLPDKNSLPNYLDNFIIFRPKDYVSGDFYWFQNFNKGIIDKEYSLVAVADCTGHGVPGLLLSSIGSRLLTEITTYMKINAPAEIFKSLNIKFLEVLKQKKVQSMDGMDIVLIKIIKKKNSFIIDYTGAKRPLFYYSNKENKIFKLKSSRKSIGGILQNNSEEFLNYNFVCQKNDILYLTTDGYIDQNNFHRERLGSERFIGILNKMAKKTMSQQKTILEKELLKWQKNELQRDDITIIGLKFTD